MSTTAQRTSYFDLIKSGQAISQAQAVEHYLSRCKIATTKMVADFLDRPNSTATRCLDTLAAQGKVVKADTGSRQTGWQYEPDPDKWPVNQKRYLLEKVQRAINTLHRANQEAGGVLSGSWATFREIEVDRIDWLISETL